MLKFLSGYSELCQLNVTVNGVKPKGSMRKEKEKGNNGDHLPLYSVVLSDFKLLSTNNKPTRA